VTAGPRLVYTRMAGGYWIIMGMECIHLARTKCMRLDRVGGHPQPENGVEIQVGFS
jgi:hypothetical protein